MAMKIDLEIAYDRISWSFVKQVLIVAGFDDFFINLIINFTSSALYNVLQNGNQTEYFFSKRLRQGDPISPLLFVLCMDRLSHLICDEVQRGCWKPVYTSKEGPHISHLMCANDLLLFGVASVSQAECMLGCLNTFLEAFGGKINRAKSSIFFSLSQSSHANQIKY